MEQGAMTARSVRTLVLLLGFTAFLCGCQAARSFVSPSFRDDDWHRYESARFSVRVRPGSAAERDIDSIRPYLEGCLDSVSRQLSVQYTGRIQYLLYASIDDKSSHALVGGTMAYSIPDLETIVAVYQSDRENFGYGIHEITHVVTYWTVGVGTSAVLTEGTAVFLSGDYGGRSPHAGALQHLRRGDLQPLTAMFDNEAWAKVQNDDSDLYYTQSGSFVQYLVDRFDIDRFKIFYNRAQHDEYGASFRQIYGIRLEDVYADWVLGLQTGLLK